VPERLTAGGSTTAGLLIFGGKRRDGAGGTFYETHGGGEGARADRDGCPVVRVHLTNTMNTPVEIVEAEYMIHVDEQRLRPNSGGTGLHRGGEGMRRAYTVLADGLSLTTMFERRVIAPYGLQGGTDGAPFRVTLHRIAGGSRELSGKENITLAKGDRVIMETSGGGGYGRGA
jgi:N-methylhydantoinase B